MKYETARALSPAAWQHRQLTPSKEKPENFEEKFKLLNKIKYCPTHEGSI